MSLCVTLLVFAIVCASVLCYYCASKSYGTFKNTVYAYYQKGYVATGEYGTVKGKKLNGSWVRLKEGNYDSGKVKAKSWPAAGSRYYRAEKSRVNNPLQFCKLTYELPFTYPARQGDEKPN